MGRLIALETKTCPYCAETIKRRAVICRFCGYDLRTGTPTTPSLASLEQSASQTGAEGEDASGNTLGCGLFVLATLVFIGVGVGLVLFFG